MISYISCTVQFKYFVCVKCVLNIDVTSISFPKITTLESDVKLWIMPLFFCVSSKLENVSQIMEHWNYVPLSSRVPAPSTSAGSCSSSSLRAFRLPYYDRGQNFQFVFLLRRINAPRFRIYARFHLSSIELPAATIRGVCKCTIFTRAAR